MPRSRLITPRPPPLPPPRETVILAKKVEEVRSQSTLGRPCARPRIRIRMDAQDLLQLAADDGLYTSCGTLAALLSAPQENLAIAAPDNSFAWSACTYSLTTPEGAWPTSFSTESPPSVGMERLPLATASGWSWHKNHQLPRLSVSCGAGAPLKP